MVTQFLDDLDQALQGLSLANAGAGFAAWSLFVLNRGDRPVTNGYFYALKRLALDEFTRRGYLTSTETLLQELPCWHTAAYNDGWDDYCPKCDNTGVYRSYRLIEARFEMSDGCRYRWHQPEQVAGPALLDAWEQGRAWTDDLDHARVVQGYIMKSKSYKGTIYQRWALLWCLWWWLRLNYQKQSELPRSPYYRTATHRVLYSWKWRFIWYWRRNSTRRLRYYWTGVLHFLHIEIDREEISEDEIPF